MDQTTNLPPSPTQPQPQIPQTPPTPPVRRSTWKIIIGILLLLGMVGRLVTESTPYFRSWGDAEGIGFNISSIFFPLLGVFLIITSKKKTVK
jgi:hypothetical protein